METASSVHTSLEPNQTTLNSTEMDTSMDIDMDIDLDLGPLPEPEPIEVEPTPAAPPATDATTLSGEPQFEKVHIRGVDELTTDDLKRFAAEHFKDEEPVRIEWIDDTSANFVYGSSETGLRALAEFTQSSLEEDVSLYPSLRLRNAKTLSTHPDSVLQVRTAVKTDRKRPRAYEASRFYLMHPEHDPRERMRREFAEKRRRGGMEGGSDDYRRRRFDDAEHKRRKNEPGAFRASMYDDDAESDQENGDVDGKKSKRNVELFPSDSSRSRGRLRDRSASPDRADSDRDRAESRRRFRDRSPRTSRDRDMYARKNAGKELFPDTTSGDEGPSRRELFPNKTASTYLKKELFPNKTSTSNHRRSDAFDAADETADLFARRISVPFANGAADTTGRPGKNKNNGVELFPEHTDSNGLSIRGTAAGNQGISIRGASKGITIKSAASVRELFPGKFTGNEGKELFSDKLQGRSGRRKKAEDMFS
ncbi:hypothetical protein VTO42DRAFT_6714 [Malbranchea cinnamomea]